MKDFLAFLEQMADGPLPDSHPIIQRRSALEATRNVSVMSSPLTSQAMLAWFGWGDSLMNGTLAIDLEKRTQLRKRLRNPSQYLDIEAEFAAAALMLDCGWQVELVEDDGMPDLYIPDEKLRIEVKRCEAGTNPRNIHSKVSKTNRRSRHYPDECYLLLFVSRANLDPPVKSALPEDVQPFMMQANQSLSDHFRSIDGAALVWDDNQLSMNSPTHGSWALRRTLTHVDRRPITREALANVGHTAMQAVGFGSQEREIGSVLNNPIVLDGKVVLLHLEPDDIAAAIDRLRSGGNRAWIQAVADHQGMILVMTNLRDDGSATLAVLHHLDDAPLALRGLYRIDTSLNPDPDNPIQAFSNLLASHGRPLGFGPYRGSFVQVVDVMLDEIGTVARDPLTHSPDRRGGTSSYWLHAVRGAKGYNV